MEKILVIRKNLEKVLYGLHKKRKKTSSNTFFIFSASFNYKIHYLCPELVSDSLSAIRIKRESGANPGQSRCCETLLES